MERRLKKARNYLSLPRKSSMNGQCRHASIKLLDGESLEITILPRITVGELHDVVADHTRIAPEDRDHFGLAWIDENTKHYHWLSGEKRLLLESELPPFAKGMGKIVLHQNVKYFVDDFRSLSQVSTVQHYFLDTQQQLAREQLDLSIAQQIQLASLLIQIFNGDLQDESQSLELLRVVVPLPKRLAKDSILTQAEWESKVLAAYGGLRGLPRGTGIVRFMEVAQSSSTYGSRFFRVLDQSSANSQCVLALNRRGVFQFNTNDLGAPRRVFEWRRIENILYKECHYTVEVRDSSSRSGARDKSRNRRGDPEESSQKTYYHFLVDSPISCRSLWSASIDQHQFYLDQCAENNLSSHSAFQSEVDQSELCERLNRLVSKSSLAPSIHSLSSLHASASSSRMPIVEADEREEVEEAREERDNERAALATEEETVEERPAVRAAPVWKGKSTEERTADVIKYKRFLLLKRELTRSLEEKMAELKRICLAEGDLTGVLPEEIRLVMRPGEEEPKLKRRIGTAFTITADMLTHKVDRVNELETEVLINRKIVAAADRLAKEKKTNKSVRKKRQKDLAEAQSKLKGLEGTLNQMRLSASKPDVSMSQDEKNELRQWSASSLRSAGGAGLTSKSCPTTPRGSMPDLAGTVSEGEDDEVVDGCGVSRPASCSLSRDVHTSMKMPSTISVSSSSAAPSGTSSSSLTSNSSMGTGRSVRRQRSGRAGGGEEEMHEDPLRVLPPSYDGYRSSASYKSSYRTVHYPTLQETETKRRTDDEDERRGFVNVKTGWEPSTYQHTSPLRVHPSTSTITSRPPPFHSDHVYPTGSLDRRLHKRISPTRHSMAAMRESGMPLSRDASPSTRVQTTFPVSSNAPLVFRKPMASQHSVPLLPSSASPSFHLQGPSAASLLTRLPPSSFSSSRLPSQPDPHMEALIDFYRDRQSKPSKTATIV